MTTTPATAQPETADALPSGVAPRSSWVRRVLPLLVFVAGMTTMGTEMAASRLLAPYFGQSVLVWANIIGLILIYLSVGYWWGGRIADRNPTPSGLSRIAMFAAATIALIPFVSAPVLDIAAGGVHALSAGAVVGSFAGTLLLFAVPITLLGMVPPYAIRLGMMRVEEAGHVAGSFYALSTIGSIVGTFGSVLLVIPFAGTQRTMLAFALALAILAIFGSARRWVAALAAVAIAALLFVPAAAVKAADSGTVIAEEESRYQHIRVLEYDSGVRTLQLNEGWAVHSVFDPESVLTGGIWDHFLPLPAHTGAGPEARMLIIGNAAGSAARAYATAWPQVRIDGVELDPGVSAVGRKYFGMDELPNLDVHTADGRPYLARNAEQWDVILVDAYRQPYIPFYLTTVEFFELVRDRLAPDGVLAINIGSTPEDDRLQDAIAGTMRAVFPTVARYRAEQFNELVLAFPDERDALSIKTAIDNGAVVASDNGLGELADLNRLTEIVETADTGLTLVTEPNRGRDLLTDDRAPVEWIVDTMILDYAEQPH